MHQARGPSHTVAPGGPIVSKGVPLAPALGPQLAPGGPGWGLGLDWGPRTLRNSSVGCRGPVCIPRKFATATPQEVLTGVPFNLAGALTPVAPRWLRPWYVKTLEYKERFSRLLLRLSTQRWLAGRHLESVADPDGGRYHGVMAPPLEWPEGTLLASAGIG